MLEQQTLFPAPDSGETLTLATFAQRAYLDYAVSVVKGRALPDVCDGQKPVQRRILYAMNEMGLASGAKPVKSARVVGDVLGKFHPHGDQAAYDAMVRMAQDFSLRYPLIDGQGNFGSRDGDGAAAMRYTEARLTPIARLLLDELDEGTVDFVDNYDGNFKEPALLPARLPVVLLNGASGIAVGMATEIPSHNLREVVGALQVLLKNPKAELDEVMAELPGPDFPGRRPDHQQRRPRSARRMPAAAARSRRAPATPMKSWRAASGSWWSTNCRPACRAQRVLEEIEELTNPKVRAGKKSLSAEQQNNKAAAAVGARLGARRIGQGKRGAAGVRAAHRKIDRDELVNVLLAHTSLESSVPINLVMIGRDGRPRQKGLVQILGEWIEFRIETVRRRSQHRLPRSQDRIHILEGRQQVLLNIDKVIKLIRNSDEPKAELMKAFSLTSARPRTSSTCGCVSWRGSKAIRSSRNWRSCARTRRRCRSCSASEGALRKQVGKEFDEDAKKFSPRQGPAPHADAGGRARQCGDEVIDEPVTVIVSEKGFVRARSGHGHDASQLSFKPGRCAVRRLRVPHRRCADRHRQQRPRLHGAGVATAVGARRRRAGHLDDRTGIRHAAGGLRGRQRRPAVAREPPVPATGFACTIDDLLSRQKGGKQFITVDDGAVPLRPALVNPATDDRIACLSAKGRLLVFAAAEIKAQSGGGRGVILMGLDAGERLIAATPCGESGVIVEGQGRGGRVVQIHVRGREFAAHDGHRARKGTLVTPRVKPTALRRPVAAPAPSE
jgi:topoisomerase IV subunit A